jgi:hypothetical protein
MEITYYYYCPIRVGNKIYEVEKNSNQIGTFAHYTMIYLEKSEKGRVRMGLNLFSRKKIKIIIDDLLICNILID